MVLNPQGENPFNQNLVARNDGAKKWPQLFGVKDIHELGIDEIAAQVKEGIDSMSGRVMSGAMSILDSTVEMGRLTRGALDAVAQKFAMMLNTDTKSLPFTIFVFGATARNQMLPNSDLDIALVFESDCPEVVKNLLEQSLAVLPFNDEIDVAHWNSVDAMRKENCPSMMEYNKVVESQFVVGNTEIAETHDNLVNGQDSAKDKEARFITEYGLLHKFDYRSRQTKDGANLKYDFGASRDIVFLDWYYLAKTVGQTAPMDRPSSYACLDLLQEKGQITPAECVQMKEKLELILFIKFALWRKSEMSGDKKLMHYSDHSIDTVYAEAESVFQERGINNQDELAYAYIKAKNALQELIEKLYKDIATSNEAQVELWTVAKEKAGLDDEVLALLENPTWNELIPFAVASTSPEILQYIVKRFGNVEGYEYVLRIISESKYVTAEIKDDLLRSRLDPRFKKKIDIDNIGNQK